MTQRSSYVEVKQVDEDSMQIDVRGGDKILNSPKHNYPSRRNGFC